MRAVHRWLATALPVLASCAGGRGIDARAPAAVECIWVLDGGSHTTTDVSPWTGDGQARPFSFANHCYLVRHRRGLLLWDTGHDDAIALEPDGVALGPTVRVHRPQTLAAQLAAIGVRPEDIGWLALSHFHLDHAGNANRFATAMLLVQDEGWRAAFGPRPERFGFQRALYRDLEHATTVRLDGDHDVFGDGSVVVLATPGHAPGHQSLFVRLPRRGAVVLSGDVAHFRANWDARRVPVGNTDRERSLASMERIADLVAREHAELWINHDPEQHAAFGPLPARIE